MLLAAPPGFVARYPPLRAGGVAALPVSGIEEFMVSAPEGATMGWVDEKDRLWVKGGCHVGWT